jgi:hypothetical protein
MTAKKQFLLKAQADLRPDVFRQIKLTPLDGVIPLINQDAGYPCGDAESQKEEDRPRSRADCASVAFLPLSVLHSRMPIVAPGIPAAQHLLHNIPD